MPRFTKQLLIASLLAVPMTFTAGDVLAKTCSSGGCGGPNNLEKAIAKVEGAESTVSNADLETAYEKIETVADEVDELSAANNSKVRAGLKKLAATLEKRANEEFQAAVKQYFDGYYEEALAKFEELAELKGLPTAKKSQQELDKEEDRVAWRTANELALKHVNNKDYFDAREPLNDMDRLARRTDYTDQTDAAIKSISAKLMPEVEAAEAMIEKEQFEAAYATLIEISRLTHARESAVAARRVLGQNARLDGMRLAKAEYEASDELSQTQTWYTAIAKPSVKEQQIYQQKLQSIANNYKGTAAAEQAQQLLVSDDAQAAR